VSTQALADFAEVILFVQRKYAKNGRLPVIAIGGSHGGQLAAYMRTKYPHIVDMAFACASLFCFILFSLIYFRWREKCLNAMLNVPFAIIQILN
jgi:alpha-beta hydrolase superfamily lysophospholipase